ncbi:MAG: sirohydrochlorin chelatase [Burkholderiaceae bacterium]
MTQAIEAVVLFGHGSRDPRWAQTMFAVAQRLEALAPGLPVRCAYLEFMRPDLPEVLRALYGSGLRRIRVSPVFLAAGGHVLRDLPELVASVRAECPGLEVEIQPVLGAAPGVIEALAQAASS